MSDATSAALWRELRKGTPPQQTAQEAFDGDARHLRRLLRLTPGEMATAGDLFDYAQDLLYTEIEADALPYLLPFCLEAWRADLMGTQSGYGGFVEYLYPALAKREIFERHLTQRQTAAVSDFMRQTILDEIDQQRGLSYQGTKTRPYRWFSALSSYGVLLPDIDRLWTDWWSLNTIGRAVATVQYISCLMYPENENPVFAPWTRDGGGGPPCLWEFEGHLYTHRWLVENVEFLKSVLTGAAATDVLVRAEAKLAKEPEGPMAKEIVADMPLCLETLEFRCAELPKILELKHKLDAPVDWDDAMH